MKVTKKKAAPKTLVRKKSVVKKTAPQKKSLTLISIILLVVGLIIMLIVAQQSQESRSRADTIVSQGTVPAQIGGKMGTTTVKNLTVGSTYKVVVSGTYYYRKGVKGWNDVMADAQWSDDRAQKTKTGTYLVRQNKPRFNGQALIAQDLGSKFNANHTYTFSWKATSAELVFSMPDSLYKDNVGGLNYAIYLFATNAEGTPIATMSGTLVSGVPGASASAAPAGNGNVATPSAIPTLTPSSTPTPTPTPTAIIPTYSCITTVGVTECNDQVGGTPGVTQPIIDDEKGNGATAMPTGTAAENPTAMPTITTAPCQTAQVKTSSTDNKNFVASIWDQLKEFFNKLVGGNDTNNNNNDNQNTPCPSVTPAS